MSDTLVRDLDSVDTEILSRRIALLDDTLEPRVGDYVRFNDGTERRISHIWPADWHEDNIARVQTSKGGSFYLDNGACSFSGSLYSGVKANTLSATGERKLGSCWFFHHNHYRAHNGVDVEIMFRVYDCSEAPTT